MNELDISKTDINLLLENIFIKKNYKRNSFVNDYLFFCFQILLYQNQQLINQIFLALYKNFPSISKS